MNRKILSAFAFVCLLASVVAAGCTTSRPVGGAAGGTLAHPSLLADPGEIAKAREWLSKYGWYRELFEQRRAEIDKFIAHRPIYVSPLKQLWAYDMYNCPDDRAELKYDEEKPFEHVCPKCGKVVKGEKYDHSWAARYNHMLSVRVQWLGILYQITGREVYAEAAREILVKFAELYPQFPNENNILGPARIFWGTLGESQFTINMATGYDLVYDSPCFTAADHKLVKEQLFYPISELLQQFPESTSNRQVIYNTAIAAIGFLYRDQRLIDIAMDGQYGMKYQLRIALPKDGLWAEGTAYQFFTLFHMIVFAEMARHHGMDFYNMNVAGHCMKSMFDAPIELAGPDYQFPQTRDSGGGNLLDTAGYYEPAWARYGDPRYAKLINQARKKGISRNSVLFFAVNPEIPDVPGDIYAEKSHNFEENGFAILRDNVGGDEKYLYLDYGIVGGEHGHPDRLSIGYCANGENWFIDPGNDSYMVPTLQTWYRQTVAHNTVTVNESKMAWGNGNLNFFGDAPGLKVASGRSDVLYGGVKLARTVLMFGDCFLDVMDAEAKDSRTYDVPYHSFGKLTVEGVSLEQQPLDIFGHVPGVPGYDLFTEVKEGAAANDWKAVFRKDDGKGLALFGPGEKEKGTVLYTAMTPGVRKCFDTRMPMVMLRRRASSTRFETLVEGFKGDPKVTGFSKGETRGEYRIKTLDDGEDDGEDEGEIVVRIDVKNSKYSAVRLIKGCPIWVSAFNMSALDNDGSTLFTADFELPRFDAEYSAGSVTVTVPEDFGRIRMFDPAVEKVIVNGVEFPFERDGEFVILTQARKGLVVRPIEPADGTVFVGLRNPVKLDVFNYSGESVKPVIRLAPAKGWQESIRAQRENWGGIVNLVATNKTDIRKVLDPDQPSSPPADWLDVPTVVRDEIPSGGHGITETEIDPVGYSSWVSGVYDEVPSVQLGNDAKTGVNAESFRLRVAEPVTADIVLPNGASNTMRVVLKNNTPGDLKVKVRLSTGPGMWGFNGKEFEVEIPASSTVHRDLKAELSGYRGDEQLYPVEMSVRCGLFAQRIRKDFYVGLCHFTEKAPSLDGSFEGWDRGTPMTIDKKNQQCRLLFGTQPWGGKDDLSAKVYAMYDAKYLYVGCEVLDDKVVEHYDPRMRYPSDTDCVEVVLDTRTNTEQGQDPPTKGAFRHLSIPEYRRMMFDSATPGDIPLCFRQVAGADSFFRRTEKGYTMIVRIPLAAFPGVTPGDGVKIGFDLAISDNDGALYRRNEFIWAGYNQNQNWLDLRLIGALIFVKDGE